MPVTTYLKLSGERAPYQQQPPQPAWCRESCAGLILAVLRRRPMGWRNQNPIKKWSYEMTPSETLDQARQLTRGTSCFVMPVGGRYQVCRRVGGRVIHLGYRTKPSDLLALVRRLTQ